jgi:hypothetical protein
MARYVPARPCDIGATYVKRKSDVTRSLEELRAERGEATPEELARAKAYSPWPAGQPEPSLQDERERIMRERMAEFERAVKAGNMPAFCDALDYLNARGVLPRWMVECGRAAVTKAMQASTGQRGNVDCTRLGRWEKNQMHFTRWELVHALREQDASLSLTDAFRAAAAELESNAVDDMSPPPIGNLFTDADRQRARGSEGVIERSYKFVEREIKAGRGGKFYATRFQPK